jgi:hypothetical protein
MEKFDPGQSGIDGVIHRWLGLRWLHLTKTRQLNLARG